MRLLSIPLALLIFASFIGCGNSNVLTPYCSIDLNGFSYPDIYPASNGNTYIFSEDDDGCQIMCIANRKGRKRWSKMLDIGDYSKPLCFPFPNSVVVAGHSATDDKMFIITAHNAETGKEEWRRIIQRNKSYWGINLVASSCSNELVLVSLSFNDIACIEVIDAVTGEIKGTDDALDMNDVHSIKYVRMAGDNAYIIYLVKISEEMATPHVLCYNVKLMEVMWDVISDVRCSLAGSLSPPRMSFQLIIEIMITESLLILHDGDDGDVLNVSNGSHLPDASARDYYGIYLGNDMLLRGMRIDDFEFRLVNISTFDYGRARPCFGDQIECSDGFIWISQWEYLFKINYDLDVVSLWKIPGLDRCAFCVSDGLLYLKLEEQLNIYNVN